MILIINKLFFVVEQAAITLFWSSGYNIHTFDELWDYTID